MEVKMRWHKEREFRAKLGAIHRKLRDTRPVMKSLAIQTLKWIQENYRTSGGKLKGKKWAPLRPSTKAGRRRGSKKPLWDTGQLLLRGWNWHVTRLKAVIGHPSEIAAYHDEGTGIYGPKGSRYVIRPVKAKALRFITSGYTVGKHGAAKRRSRLNYAFAKYVLHPGVRQRRQLPTEDEIGPILIRTADLWLDKVTK
jgi:phage gpG-like protein